MSYKYGQKLPAEVEKKLNAYIKRIKKIQWFKPAKNLKKSDVDKQVQLSIEAFGVKAGVEYRSLKTPQDWDAAFDAAFDAAWEAARGVAFDAAWEAAWDAAFDAAFDAAWEAARGVAFDAAREAAWDAARGAQDILVENLDDYKKKYPNGSFINLIPLWEMGLYPVGVIDGKFVVYVPPCNLEFPNDLIK